MPEDAREPAFAVTVYGNAEDRVPGAAGGYGTDGAGNRIRCDPRNGYIDGCPTPNGRLPIVLSITIGEAF